LHGVRTMVGVGKKYLSYIVVLARLFKYGAYLVKLSVAVKVAIPPFAKAPAMQPYMF